MRFIQWAAIALLIASFLLAGLTGCSNQGGMPELTVSLIVPVSEDEDKLIYLVEVANVGNATAQQAHLFLESASGGAVTVQPAMIGTPPVISLIEGYTLAGVKIDGQSPDEGQDWLSPLTSSAGLPIGDIAPSESRVVELTFAPPGIGG